MIFFRREKLYKGFWAFCFWIIKRVHIVALVSYLLGVIFAAFIGDIQIFGPNILRQHLAGWLSSLLEPVASLQVAGSVIDPKKLALYVCCVGLLLSARAVFKYELKRAGKTFTSSNLRELLKWRKDIWTVFSVALVILVIIFYSQNNLLPRGADHVFGFKGVGLISNFSRDHAWFEHLGLVLYRLSYLPVYFLLFIVSALVLPPYLRISTQKAEESSTVEKSQLTEKEMIESVLQIILVPLAGIIFIAVLLVLTSLFGIGELQDVPLTTAYGIAVVLFTWLILGFVWLVRREVNPGGPFQKLAGVVMGMYKVQKAILILGTVMFISVLVPFLVSLPISNFNVLHSKIWNRFIEYCNWEITTANSIYQNMEIEIKNSVDFEGQELSTYWEMFGVVGNAGDSREESLYKYIIDRTLVLLMLQCSVRNDSTLKADFGTYWKTSERDNSVEIKSIDWLFALKPKDVMKVTEELAGQALSLKERTWFYDKSIHDIYRRRTVYLLAEDLSDSNFVETGMTKFLGPRPINDSLQVFEQLTSILNRIANFECTNSLDYLWKN